MASTIITSYDIFCCVTIGILIFFLNNLDEQKWIFIKFGLPMEIFILIVTSVLDQKSLFQIRTWLSIQNHHLSFNHPHCLHTEIKPMNLRVVLALHLLGIRWRKVLFVTGITSLSFSYQRKVCGFRSRRLQNKSCISEQGLMWLLVPNTWTWQVLCINSWDWLRCFRISTLDTTHFHKHSDQYFIILTL